MRASRAARRRGTSATTTSTRSPLESRSPATPAKPSPRRSSTSPAGASWMSTGGWRSAASSRSQNEPSSPSALSSPSAGGQSARRSTRGSTAPFQRFASRRTAAWCGSRAPGVSAVCVVPNETPRARAVPVTSVKRACWRSSPIAGHVLEPRRRHEQGRLRVAGSERAQQVDLLRQLEAERAPGHHGVDALHRHQVGGAEARAGVGRERPAKRLDGLRGRARHPRPSGARRSARGARRRRRSPRAGRRPRCCAPTLARFRRTRRARSPRRGGASVRRAATPRCRPRPGATPPPPRPSRPRSPGARRRPRPGTGCGSPSRGGRC